MLHRSKRTSYRPFSHIDEHFDHSTLTKLIYTFTQEVAERLACSPPTKAIRVQSPGWVTPGFSHVETVYGRCRWSAGFLRDLPFPPHFHSGTSPYSHQSPSPSPAGNALDTSRASVALEKHVPHGHQIREKPFHRQRIGKETKDEVDRSRWLRATNLSVPTLNCFSANTSTENGVARHRNDIQPPQVRRLAAIHRAASGIRQRAGITWPEFVDYLLPARFRPIIVEYVTVLTKVAFISVGLEFVYDADKHLTCAGRLERYVSPAICYMLFTSTPCKDEPHYKPTVPTTTSITAKLRVSRSNNGEPTRSFLRTNLACDKANRLPLVPHQLPHEEALLWWVVAVSTPCIMSFASVRFFPYHHSHARQPSSRSVAVLRPDYHSATAANCFAWLNFFPAADTYSLVQRVGGCTWIRGEGGGVTHQPPPPSVYWRGSHRTPQTLFPFHFQSPRQTNRPRVPSRGQGISTQTLVWSRGLPVTSQASALLVAGIVSQPRIQPERRVLDKRASAQCAFADWFRSTQFPQRRESFPTPREDQLFREHTSGGHIGFIGLGYAKTIQGVQGPESDLTINHIGCQPYCPPYWIQILHCLWSPAAPRAADD
ncbi:hypothetical protein PR048_002649 [Dryococelus australis]|uniref:Uncharacterized protein n=1 Tax=Dryococelus australis TaxID=614101 RepID=A0ABQ9IKT6_9NEOP|nr:hypothetical protein PR048_002649 [Dryococelus australis]